MELRLRGRITEDHQLILDIPADVEPGDVDVIVRRKVMTFANGESLDERIERLLREGKLLRLDETNEGVELTPEDREFYGTLPRGARSSLDLINEDREER